MTRNDETITSTGARQVHQAVGVTRNQIFLGDQLDRVGNRLKLGPKAPPG